MEIIIKKDRPNYFKSHLKKLKTGRGVILQAGEGKSAKEILSCWPGTVFLVDSWSDSQDVEIRVPGMAGETVLLRALDRIKLYGDRAILTRTSTEKAGNLFGPESLDFVFLQDITTYEEVKITIKEWIPKIKPGGVIGGFGFLNSNLQNFGKENGNNQMIWNEDGVFLGYFGVNRAVIETVGLRFDVDVTSEEVGSWFVTLE